MESQELLQKLKAYALRSRSGTVDLKQLLSYAGPDVTEDGLDALLQELVKAGTCTLLPPVGRPHSVTLTDYYLALLEEEYRALSADPLKPFPQERTFPVPIPASQVAALDLKSNFGQLFDEVKDGDAPVASLVFPENIDQILVPRSAAGSYLLEASLIKVAAYLADPKNAGYAESKLMSIFKGSDMLVRQMVDDATTRPKKAAEGLSSPTDFTFRFWTYLVNLTLQDIRKKKDKTVQDHGVCQSAYIVGYYAFYQKRRSQKEQELAADRKSLEHMVRKPPYVFTFENLYAFKDEKGVPFISKHTRDFIHSFLREKLQRTESEGLPFLVRLHDANRNKDYFIQKDLVVPVFLQKLSEASEGLREWFLDDWLEKLKQHERTPVMKDDSLFRKDVTAKVKEDYPLLACLANAPLLYLAREEASLSADSAQEIQRCFQNEDTLKPLETLLGLQRSAIFSQAWSYLPVWETMPVLRHIVALFRRIFSQRERVTRKPARAVARVRASAPESRSARPSYSTPVAETDAETDVADRKTASSDKQALERYRKAIQLLREHYAPPGKSLEDSLDELSEKWNPLFAEAPKRNLVEDVNALVRDFLKPVKRTLMVTPPTSARIQALAEQLSTSKSLAKIKKREALVRYIELYMIKCLEPKKKVV